MPRAVVPLSPPKRRLLKCDSRQREARLASFSVTLGINAGRPAVCVGCELMHPAVSEPVPVPPCPYGAQKAKDSTS